MKVNIGCGTSHVLDDWVNIDGSFNARLAQYPRIRYSLYQVGLLSEESYNVEWDKYIDDILIHDVRAGVPFEAESVDYVFSSHLIEHLSKKDTVELLAECRRVLKPDGVVRISTPDLRIFAEEYLDGVEESIHSAEDLPADNFVRRLGFPVEESRRSLFTRLLDTHRSVKMHQHKWLYDVQSLRETFLDAGFNEEAVSRWSFQQGNVPDLDRLDNRPETSIYMEGIKI